MNENTRVEEDAAKKGISVVVVSQLRESENEREREREREKETYIKPNT